MIERKKKICKTCQTPQYLWAYGNCKSCDAKVKAEGKGVVTNSFTCTNKDLIPTYKKVYSTLNKPYRASTKDLNSLEDKSIPELLKLAVIVFHKWIRKRDSFDGLFYCICCGLLKEVSEMDAAHYMNAGNHSATRFNEHNVNGCCINCNRFLHGNIEAYRANLVKKIGLQAVRDLERLSISAFKWDREELYEIINKYK